MGHAPSNAKPRSAKRAIARPRWYRGFATRSFAAVFAKARRIAMTGIRAPMTRVPVINANTPTIRRAAMTENTVPKTTNAETVSVRADRPGFAMIRTSARMIAATLRPINVFLKITPSPAMTAISARMATNVSPAAVSQGPKKFATTACLAQWIPVYPQAGSASFCR